MARKRARVGRTAKGRIKKGYYLPCTGGAVRKAKAKKRKTTRRRKRR